MIIGYARVSTEEQSHDLQIDALKKAGCEKIFLEKASGGDKDRPVLKKCRGFLQKGDTLVFWKLDRLARSVTQLIEIVEDCKARGIEIKSITDQIDTASATGKLIFHIFAAFAEFERNVISMRTLEGLAAARARGRVGGWPKGRPRLRLVQQA
jgi:DNA invertase Pin-like site-specific DNA recombinase